LSMTSSSYRRGTEAYGGSELVQTVILNVYGKEKIVSEMIGAIPSNKNC